LSWKLKGIQKGIDYIEEVVYIIELIWAFLVTIKDITFKAFFVK
jgi:hypothetical protein